MYLEKLEIQGFKSFANKTVLEFNEGITAIVGPNGSGKSNIADAVRWVLGEQSLKLIRGKKSQDVIFAGSSKKARLGMAEVSIFIDNQDRQAPIDYSNLIITRRIYQNGEGEYYINRNKVRLQDILLLIAKANFGQKSYSVIGQGMSDSILTSSPQERKDFFDEAAGVKQYQIKRDQAFLKLEHTNENLQQAEMLIQEIEPRLRSLTRQVKKLEKREELEKELKTVQNSHYSSLWNEFNKQRIVKDKSHTEQNGRLKSIERERERIQKEIDQIAREDTRAQLFQKFQNEHQFLIEEKNKLRQEQIVLQGKTELKRIQAGQSDIVWLEKKKTELEHAGKNAKKELEEIEIKLAKEKASLEQYLARQKKVMEEFSGMEQEMAESFERMQRTPELDLPVVKEMIEKIYQSQSALKDNLNNAQTVEEARALGKDALVVINLLEALRKQIKNIPSRQEPLKLKELQNRLTELMRTKDNLVNEINQRNIAASSLENHCVLMKKNLKNSEEELEKMNKELKLVRAAAENPEAAKELVEKEATVLIEKISALEEKIIQAQGRLNTFNKEEQGKKDQLVNLQQEMQIAQQKLNEIGNELNETKVDIAKIETRIEDLEKEILENLQPEDLETIKSGKPEVGIEPAAASYEERIENIQRMKHNLELIGGIDPATQQEYADTDKRYSFLTTQIGDLKKAVVSLEGVIDELDEKIKEQFKDAFDKINTEFGKYFKSLFGGGKASLALKKEELPKPDVKNAEEEDGDEDENDADEGVIEPKVARRPSEKIISGIEIQACPPGKKTNDLNVLSGGEKAMTSIALICAIIANNPPPFAILDEMDAALDEANSIKFAQILKDLSHKTQFIAITHNRATMHHASILYGVTVSDDGVSRLLSVKMEDVDKIRNSNPVNSLNK